MAVCGSLQAGKLISLTCIPFEIHCTYMQTAAKKTAFIRTRVRPKIKKDAERVFDRLGISTTDAVSVFLRQVALQNGLPFDIKVPNEDTRAAFTEDLTAAKHYNDTDTMFKDILGAGYRSTQA